MRTGHYRLTRYFRNEQPVVELYDHQKDPEEKYNVAADYPPLVKRLLRQWEKVTPGFTGNRV